MLLAIMTKVLGPTAHSDLRVTAWTIYGQRVTIPWPNCGLATESHFMAVKELCKRNSWAGTFAWGAIPGGLVFVHVDDSNSREVP